MVQIVAPSATTDLTSSEAATAKTVQLPPTKSSSETVNPSETKTRSASKTAAKMPAPPAPKPAAAAAPSVAESSEELFADAAAMLSGEVPPTETPATPEPAAAAASTSPVEPIASDAPAVATSTKFATYRLVAMIGGGVVVGGLLLAMVIRAILVDDQPVAQVTPPDATPAEVAEETPAAEPAAPAEKIVETTPPINPAAEVAAANEPEAPAAEMKPMPEEVAEKPPAELPLDETKPGENPFLFDMPEGAKPSSKPAAENVAAGEAPETTDDQRMKFANDPLTGVLGEAFPLFDESMFEAPASQSLAESAEPEAPLPDPATMPALEAVVQKPAPRAVDVSARLNDPYINARFRDISLMDHLRNLTRWSTIPISVDPLALQSADIAGDKKINVNQKGTNTERLLRGAVEPLRMSVDVRGDQVRIVPLQQAGMKPPTVRFQVDDLASDDPAVAELAYTVTHLVEPTSWQGAGGTNTCRTGKKELQLAADSEAVFQSLVLVEKLRVARSLAPRSRYEEKLFKLEPRSEQAAALLDKKVQLSFAEPAELLEIVEQLEGSTGAIILIDWESLLREGWNPDTKATMLAIDVPLRDALHTLLSPLDMDFRIIDDRTMQIAMKSDIAQHGDVEFYPISDLADGPTQAAALINRLKKDLALPDDPQFAMIYDAPSKNLLVRLPQAKQVELAQLLAKLRTL
ncbi:hypothetical protein LOC68_26025 [Blastopirellula sp. JC732]|uniref:Uncharacterized protein n=1 Tax=Blastopirellula sediminis TaxID=2894196 RepID=A0A9X1MSP3_9BACT|nr:hypothetical protein [Blastopirellula sediminis]MCC9604832.1 hypothetical protein [Blastopirellula sediminis]MCC9631869.1 hypothetical protein [Blastopirellula sediminis]